MILRAPAGAGRGVLVLAGPVLLAGHTLAFTSDIDYASRKAWRRMWSDLAIATAAWVDHVYGPAPHRVVAWDDEAEARVRRLILERIDRDGLSPSQPLATIRARPFVRERIVCGPNPYDDKGRAVLLSLAFRLRGGIAPFLILWLGWLAVVPVLVWIAVELCAAGHSRAAAAFLALLVLSPFVVETLALPRYPVGFYLVGLLLVVPLAVYAHLHPAPTGLGLGARAATAAVVLALCVYCRSSAALLLPGFVLAAGLGVRRITASRRLRWAATAGALLLFTLSWPIVARAQKNDMWQPIWEGLGDFDRAKGHAWSDAAAEQAARRAGARALWTRESEGVFRDQVLADVKADPSWFAGILVRRLGATVTLWKLWPWNPGAGPPLRRSTTPNEGVMDKYWGYTTTIDHVGFGPIRVEVPVAVMLAPAFAMAMLACTRRFRARVAGGLLVAACPALAALTIPVLITTAGGQEAQAFGVAYLLAAAFATELGASRPTEPDAGR